MKTGRHRRERMQAAGVLTLLGALLMSASGAVTSGRQLNTAPQDVPIYVRDFELAVANEHNLAATKPASRGSNARNTSSPAKQVEALQAQARMIQDFVAETLVETLQKNGYSSLRRQDRPQNGVVLAGVFAEPDGKNRIRRALLGGRAPGTKFTLYVGTFDQKILNQPLYKEAPAQTQEPDENYGPVITLNAYMPLAKYEIDKDASEQQIQKVCQQIAENLTALLKRNPGAVTESK